MNDDGVRTERRGRVLVVTMDRGKANAINHAMSRAMFRAFTTLQEDPELLVGILRSANPKIFSGGWDLKEVASGIHLPDDYYDPEIGHGRGGFAGLAENWELDKPLIAAVQGAAVGGGFEMILACDTIIAAEGTYFQLPELMRGFLPDAGGIQRLPKLIPPKVAGTMILTGRRMPAEEAMRWGLVHDVVPAAALMDEAMKLAETVVKAAPLATQALKAVLRQNENLSAREASDRARRGHSGLPIYERMMRSEDFYEGPRAFAEKRDPVWKGK
ncbi:MAG TPA: enoyl-CoA hydratase-related protein [Dongiaceae bacterium]|jgi:crotonobetainyl-CoA hydratase|nr:enoyl-CoA hydratase-related protein [Dongiaceae bacterium]